MTTAAEFFFILFIFGLHTRDLSVKLSSASPQSACSCDCQLCLPAIGCQQKQGSTQLNVSHTILFIGSGHCDNWIFQFSDTFSHAEHFEFCFCFTHTSMKTPWFREIQIKIRIRCDGKERKRDVACLLFTAKCKMKKEPDDSEAGNPPTNSFSCV